MYAIPRRRGLAWLATVSLMSFGMVGMSATTASALPLQCTGTETNGVDNITCPFLLPGQTINSLGGNDTITILLNAGGTVNSGGGNDTVTATTLDGAADFNTGSGDDIVRILGNHDGTSISTAGGDDLVEITGNNSGLVDTGANADRFIVHGSVLADQAFLGSGDDFANINILTASDGISGGSLHGGDGTDTLTVAVCTLSTVAGEDGADTIDITDANACTVLGGAGNDSIHEGAEATGTVDGGPGNDTCQEDIPFLGTETNCEI
ncbi:hypothetical protein [Streptomyces sp. NBC_00091]|uniref:hypothetical protein n=1 Tax=Streptomyces sp. NBC_00091 TaxID=2975648 RepID=UPI00224FA3FA|nr:hypothetical protein [Streptomyces sp. NBC_00091]MCX5380343.1 hypothetical protein [Streptomyces sp. NBC_00091]